MLARIEALANEYGVHIANIAHAGDGNLHPLLISPHDADAAFQRRILEVTATIPRGEVRPYGWVARQAGNAAAVRAAGTALGHNPVPFVVPCHRVVRSDWTLGQYSAGGPEVKDRILRWEGCDVAHIEQLAANARFFSHPGSGAFCLPACGTLSGTNVADLIAFRDAPSALAAGYIACDDCRPA